MVLKDKIYIDVKELGYKVSHLCELFTYKNPEIYQKKHMKLSTNKIPPYLFHYKLEDDHSGQVKVLQVPRGGLEKVIDFYKKHKIPIRILDQRMLARTIDVHLKKVKLEKQQCDIIEVLIKNEGGLVEASPGAGKTIAALGLISEVKQPTLILTHEHRLSSQWVKEIQNKLGGDFTLGKYDGDVKEDGDIVVGIINSVYRLYKENPHFFDKFGMVIVDESHHIPAHMFLSVINNIPAKYRIGVTGTVKRKDQKEILAYDVLGKLLTKIEAGDIKHRITDFDYKIIDTDLEFELPTRNRWTGEKRENVLDMAQSLTQLVENNSRNDMIVNEAVACIASGYFPLILSDRVMHNELIHDRLTALGYKTALLIGKTRKKMKWESIRNDETMQCIVANSRIASEGLDLPRLSALLLTCPSSNVQKIKQQLGRIRRVHPEKPLPLVIDFCDNLAYLTEVDEESGEETTVFPLERTAKKRLRFYRALRNEYNG